LKVAHFGAFPCKSLQFLSRGVAVTVAPMDALPGVSCHDGSRWPPQPNTKVASKNVALALAPLHSNTVIEDNWVTISELILSLQSALENARTVQRGLPERFVRIEP
jgi:hypothetical protein